MALNHARLPVPPLALVTPSTSETPFSLVAQGLSRLLRSQATPQLEATATGGNSVENRSGSGFGSAVLIYGHHCRRPPELDTHEPALVEAKAGTVAVGEGFPQESWSASGRLATRPARSRRHGRRIGQQRRRAHPPSRSSRRPGGPQPRRRLARPRSHPAPSPRRCSC
jgi:hypothetical protein